MELGSRLREARNAKGMSLEEVQASTKIQKRYLQAIEENNFDILPGKFYTRAFIREYASTVGLNPEEVMEEHKSELPSMDEETTIPYSRVQKSKQQPSSKGSSSGKSSKVFPAIITAALVIVIAFVIYFFTQQLSTPSETEPENDEPQDEVVISNDEESGNEEGQGENSGQGGSGESTEETDSESENTEENTSPEDTEEETQEEQATEVQLQQTGTGGFPEHTYQVTGAEEKQVTIELSGESYLEVAAPKNGENLIEPIIYSQADSPLTIDASAHDQLFLKTGSAGVLNVSVDGQAIEFPADVTTQKLLINFN